MACNAPDCTDAERRKTSGSRTAPRSKRYERPFSDAACGGCLGAAGKKHTPQAASLNGGGCVVGARIVRKKTATNRAPGALSGVTMRSCLATLFVCLALVSTRAVAEPDEHPAKAELLAN